MLRIGSGEGRIAATREHYACIPQAGETIEVVSVTFLNIHEIAVPALEDEMRLGDNNYA